MVSRISIEEREMQKSKIEWTEFVSNPVRGKCLHAYSYCYAERIRLRFKLPAKLSWHPEELFEIEKRKKPATIFMGSMHDIFGEWVPDSWISWIIDTAKNCPQHTFLFLTKNVVRYRYFDFCENCWLGVTDDCKNSDTYPLDDFAEYYPAPARKFISFEPLLGRIGIPVDVDQIIIGAQTGTDAVLPKKEWVDEIIEKSKGKKIFLKNNLYQYFPTLPMKQETAWKL